MRIKLFLILSVTVLTLNGQDSKFGLTLSGYVKTDIYYDSRQTVNIREGHFFIYPENVKYDLTGKDVNAKDQFGILTIQSRFNGKITGPDVLKAKSSAMIEADFFGNENASFSDVNGFRLRHAIIRLNWNTTELMVGQYWHPLFVPQCFPDVVSFNTGAPFHPFSRNPLIQITQTKNNSKFIVAAASQRDFMSPGPDGASTKYIRNAVLPDLNVHWQYTYRWNEGNELFMGAGGEYKHLVPRLSSQTDKNLKDGKDTIFYSGSNRVKSYAITGYSKLQLKAVSIKAYAVYGSNLYDHIMLGGYAVTSVNADMQYEYTPVKTFSLWSEIIASGKIQPAIFFGYSRNLGTETGNNGTYYSRGSNINHIYRIAPRLIINIEKFRTALEVEYTTAQYGSPDTNGLVNSNLTDVSNLRLLMAFYYFF